MADDGFFTDDMLRMYGAFDGPGLRGHVLIALCLGSR
jgi:hypothetical protein